MNSKDPIHLEAREQRGERLFSPTAARNKAPIGEVISQHIPQGAKVLEIASGTGEHGAYMCGLRPDITWQPSDPNAESRLSQNDWGWIVMAECCLRWILIRCSLAGLIIYRGMTQSIAQI